MNRPQSHEEQEEDAAAAATTTTTTTSSSSSSSSFSRAKRPLEALTALEDHQQPQQAACNPTTRCQVCKGGGAFVELVPCSHRFHARCVFGWPVRQCCTCLHAVQRVRLLTNDKTLLQIKPKPSQNKHQHHQQEPHRLQQHQAGNAVVSRKGKWSDDEFRYANALMRLFQQGTLPLADGLHLRAFLAHLLQCDPLRVTKKYAGQAIGKQNYVYRGPNGTGSPVTLAPAMTTGTMATMTTTTTTTMCFTSHVRLQKRLTSLRNHFYWNLQYRATSHPGKSSTQAIDRLKQAETNYWIQQFHRFAMRIGQQVEFANSWSSTNDNEQALQEPPSATHSPMATSCSPSSSAPATPVLAPVPITPPAKKKLRVFTSHPVQDPVYDKTKQLLPPPPPSQPCLEDECVWSGSSSDGEDCTLHSGIVSPLSLDEWNEAACRLESIPSDLLGNFADLEFLSALDDDNEPIANGSSKPPQQQQKVAQQQQQQQQPLDLVVSLDDEQPQSWNWSSLSWWEF